MNHLNLKTKKQKNLEFYLVNIILIIDFKNKKYKMIFYNRCLIKTYHKKIWNYFYSKNYQIKN